MNFKIDVNLVKRLITMQFPEWQSLPISPFENSGWDNRTFHLGDDKVIRLPSALEYEPQIQKEFEWLPKLAPQLSFKITRPIKLGKPSTIYPLHWSINYWIEGKSASRNNIQEMKVFARTLGERLKEFRSLDSTDGPQSGAHNFFRGGSLSAYDHEMQIAIPKIKSQQEREIATALWHDALSSEWQLKPAWVHGDIAVGNILVHEGAFEALIDFGQLAIGDPACDLVIAWNFFDDDERAIFKNAIQLDHDTWMRALGWAFWKTLCWPTKETDVKPVLKRIFASCSSSNWT